MRGKLAKSAVSNQTSNPDRVIILGPRRAAQLIASKFQALGFAPVFEADLPSSIPTVRDPDAVSKLRDLLKPWARAGVCLHPGLSPWADRAELASICQELDLLGVLPPARVLQKFAHRLIFLGEAERLQIPNLVLSPEPLHTVREIQKFIQLRIDHKTNPFPLVLRPVYGGDVGVGIQVIRSELDIQEKLPLWLEQVRLVTGEGIVFVEKYLEGARNISVPFVRYGRDAVRLFPTVEGSLQGHHRKLIEFCPADQIASGIDATVLEKLHSYTISMAESLGCLGVGVFQYLVEGDRVYLKEGACRLNSSFQLWETIAGTSAIECQIAAYLNRPEPETKPESPGFGCALHLYAEDPVLDLPQPGIIHALSSTNGIHTPFSVFRFDSEYSVGEIVPANSDGKVGQVHVFAKGKNQCLNLANDKLDSLWIAGGLQTNERFLKELLTHPWIQEGVFHSGFVEEDFIPTLNPGADVLKGFKQVCATLARETGLGLTGWSFGDVQTGNSILTAPVAGQEMAVWEGVAERWEFEGSVGLDGVLVGGIRVCAFPLSRNSFESRWMVRVGNWSRVIVRRGESRFPIIPLVAQFSGRVHALLFREGSSVPPHESIVLVESLQRLVALKVGVPVVLQEWKVKPEEEIKQGQVLALFVRKKEEI